MLWWAYTNAIGSVGVGMTLKSNKGNRVVASILGEICPQEACKFRASRIEYQSIFDKKQTNPCTNDTYSRCNACAKSPYGGVIYMAISEPVGNINFCCKISCFRRALFQHYPSLAQRNDFTSDALPSKPKWHVPTADKNDLRVV